MSFKGRVITLVLVVDDPEDAKKIWAAHGEGKVIQGCRPTGIADGDLIERSWNFEELLREAADELDRSTLYEDSQLTDKIDKALKGDFSYLDENDEESK